MCGLALCVAKKKKHTGQRVWDLYQAQKTRGQQGFGFVSISNGKLKQVFRSTGETDVKKALMKENSSLILFHHRFPTSTENTLGTAHPIFVSNKELEYDYYISHNGVISNHAELKKKHEELGYFYTTEFKTKTVAVYRDGREESMGMSYSTKYNDSESLAIELARYMEDKSDVVGISGSAAFWIVQVHKGSNQVESISFGKNAGRSLKVLDNNKWYIVSSETGDDLEDLKIWTNKLSDDSWTEKELVLPPVVTNVPVVQAQNVWNNQTRIGYGVHQASLASRASALELKNKYYTTLERDETGKPPSEFYQVWIRGEVYWKPLEFMGSPASLPDKDKETATKSSEWLAIPIAIRNRLEELASEYIKTENKKEVLEENLSYGAVPKGDEAITEQKIDELDMELQLLEEQIGSLDVDPEIIDEVLNTTRELEDYNSSYSVLSPYHRR